MNCMGSVQLGFSGTLTRVKNFASFDVAAVGRPIFSAEPYVKNKMVKANQFFFDAVTSVGFFRSGPCRGV
ncbi:unnamed protein product [Enterobius vermicularis]|uniref:Peptidase A1 domain-containing protein n=1 Tax=Enterobius vermicularis TaxID=51028 RepID=A0A0N4VHJ0_ENTVE|nr:unnamed protein product [Enterobius vermicularis]